MEIKPEWEDALSKAKIGLMKKADAFFFVEVCFSLKHEFTYEVNTAATNGKVIKYNPDFFMGLTKGQQIFLLIHETKHVAYAHIARCKDKKLNHYRYNVAADYMINCESVDNGYEMIDGVLLDTKYRGLSTEEIYNLLPETPEEEIEPDVEECADQDEREIQDTIIRASIRSKLAGKGSTIPSEVKIYLDKLLNPKLPLKVILARYFNAYAKKDYTWSRPNKRYLPEYYLPSMRSPALVELGIAIDASGSVSLGDFHTFISEIAPVLSKLKPKHIDLITFDYEIRQIDRVKTLHQLKSLEFTGRGGTRLEPVMEWANEHKPKVLLIFTDGYVFTMPEKPDCDVIWLIHNNPDFVCDYGRVIHYEI